LGPPPDARRPRDDLAERLRDGSFWRRKPRGVSAGRRV